MDDGDDDDDDTDDDDTDDDTDDDHDDDDTDDDNDHKNDSYTAAGAAPGASVPCSFVLVPAFRFLRSGSCVLVPSFLFLRSGSFVPVPSFWFLRSSSCVLVPSGARPVDYRTGGRPHARRRRLPHGRMSCSSLPLGRLTRDSWLSVGSREIPGSPSDPFCFLFSSQRTVS